MRLLLLDQCSTVIKVFYCSQSFLLFSKFSTVLKVFYCSQSFLLFSKFSTVLKKFYTLSTYSCSSVLMFTCTHICTQWHPYGGTDLFSRFPLFLKRAADVLVNRLGVVFRQRLRLGNFPASWKLAYVSQISEGLPSSSVTNYRPNSI